MKCSEVKLDYIKIGKRISKNRKEKNLSGRDFSLLVGISSNYLSAIECGKKHPTLETWIAISETLDISLDYLIFGIPKPDDFT